MGSSFEPTSPVQNYVQDQLTIVMFTATEVPTHDEVQSLRDDLNLLLEESDVGVVVDCGQLTGTINSFLLGSLVGVAKTARRSRKEFAVCSLQGAMQDAYDLARISSEVPAYEDAASAIVSLGIPDPSAMAQESIRQPVRRDLTKAKKRSQKKASVSAPSKPDPETESTHSSFDFEEHGPKLAMAGGLFAVALLFMFGWAYGSTLWAMMPSSAAEMELTLTGRVSYMNGGVAADDSGALVIAWPQGAQPSQSLTMDDLVDLSEGAGNNEGIVFATRADNDGSYTLQIQGETKAELLNVLVVSNNLKETSSNSSSLSNLDRVFEDPTEVVGKRGHELGFVVIESPSPKFDITLSPRYVVR